MFAIVAKDKDGKEEVLGVTESEFAAFVAGAAHAASDPSKLIGVAEIRSIDFAAGAYATAVADETGLRKTVMPF